MLSVVDATISRESNQLGEIILMHVYPLCVIWIRRTLVLPSLLLVLVGIAFAENTSFKRPVTVSDGIEMTKLNLPFTGSGVPSSGDEVSTLSPDGSQVVIVVRKGSLKTNTNDYSVLLWKTAEAFHGKEPRVALTMSSSSNRMGIEQVKWLSDNQTLAFLGEHPGEGHQVYTFNVRKNSLNQITHHVSNVLSYDIDSRAGVIAYVAEDPEARLFDAESRRQGIVIAKQNIYQLVTGERGGPWTATPKLFLQTHSLTSGPIELNGRIDINFSSPHVSPDGRSVLIGVMPNPPVGWTEYTNKDVRRELPYGETSVLTRYDVIDVATARARVLLEAPALYFTRAAWEADSRSVIVDDTLLPLEGTQGAERTIRADRVYSVEINAENRTVTTISQGELELVRWDAQTNCATFRMDRTNMEPGGGPKLVSCKRSGVWVEGNRGDLSSRPEIVLDQDMNTPPRIVVMNSRNAHTKVLLDLNPQFSSLKFGRVEEITWKRGDGRELKAGLYYPVDYVSGRRYPLVIQTHAWIKSAFWIDGPWSTAFAAQALAGKGMMVAQLDEESTDKSTPLELERELGTYESVIAYLDGKGLIDLDRVGAIGFSRTVTHLCYALTHSKYHFAAASITDGLPGGYYDYILFSRDPEFAQDFEGLRGGPPWGSGLQMWLKLSPTFSLDKVDAPVRIVALSRGSVLGLWEPFAALTRLGKPVEMVEMEDGNHELVRPWQRMVSSQGNVDWFAFWLNNDEDPNPGKASQYARWRQLREMQQSKLKRHNSQSSR
jgi:dipeptidyl aminopeptidase/acylaminoacyl peptidase